MPFRLSSPLAAGLLSLAGSSLAAPAATGAIAVPSTVPSAASPNVPLSFPGFAFEEASFYLYATDENGDPNTFSQNLINGVLKRTGGAPVIRVGGTSGDDGTYNASQAAPAIPDGRTNPPQWVAPYLTLGDSFFTAFQNFPGAKYIFMVPFIFLDLNNTLEWARQGLNNIPEDALEALEIGNEPTFYPWFTGAQSYVEEFANFQNALIEEFPRLNQTPTFQALDVASGSVADLRAQAAFSAGINANNTIKSVAYHYYEGHDHPNQTLAQLQARVVNHTVIANHLANYKIDIVWMRQNHPDIPYILDENGNTLDNADMMQRNQLATSLWNLDFQLQCMSLGVARVNMMNIFYPGYSMWQPQAGGLIPPAVHANYYSQPLIGDFIGTANNTRAYELTLPPTIEIDTHSAYAAYDGGNLARVVLVNMELWDEGSGIARPTTNYTLTGLPAGTVTAQYLTAPEGAYANDTLTYGGQQWSYPSGEPAQIKNDSEEYTVSNGELTICLNATSAVLLTWC